MQVKINQKLLEEEAIVPFELEKIKVRYESAAKRVQENEQRLEEAKTVLGQTQQRRDEFNTHEVPEQSEDAALEAIRKQIAVQEEIMKGLLEQLAAWKTRRAVELKSPIDGIIIPIHGQRNDALLQRPGEEILRRPGEVVRAGDPILAVAEAEPTEVVAYVNEQQLGLLKEQMPVELVKTHVPPQIGQSKVAAVGPTIELMPQRLWRNPNLPQWGRPVLIDIPAGLRARAGRGRGSPGAMMQGGPIAVNRSGGGFACCGRAVSWSWRDAAPRAIKTTRIRESMTLSTANGTRTSGCRPTTGSAMSRRARTTSKSRMSSLPPAW